MMSCKILIFGLEQFSAWLEIWSIDDKFGENIIGNAVEMSHFLDIENILFSKCTKSKQLE